MIANSIKDRNKSKREEMTKNFESEIKDFDVSDKFGDDRCMVYYDKSGQRGESHCSKSRWLVLLCCHISM